jgi:hypothetical protein
VNQSVPDGYRLFDVCDDPLVGDLFYDAGANGTVNDVNISARQMAELVQVMAATAAPDGLVYCVGEDLTGGEDIYAYLDGKYAYAYDGNPFDEIKLHCDGPYEYESDCQIATRLGEDPPAFMLLHLGKLAGRCMESAWKLHGICMEAAWKLHKGCLEAAWQLHGSRMVAAW